MDGPVLSISYGEVTSVEAAKKGTPRAGEPFYILGLSGGFHDSAAVLLKIAGGRLEPVAMVEEERGTRIKHEGSRTPVHAIRDILAAARIDLAEVGHVAVGWDYTRYEGYREEYLKFREAFSRLPPPDPAGLFGKRHLSQGEYNACLSIVYPEKLTVADFGPEGGEGRYEEVEIRILETYSPRAYLSGLREMFSRFGATLPPVTFVRHHLAHAASAYYPSGFRGKALIFVADAAGEGGDATTLWMGDGTAIRSLEVWRADQASLGRLYTIITEYLGFKHHEEEGHVMGLAPYGNPDRHPLPGEHVDKASESKSIDEIRERFRRFCNTKQDGFLKLNPRVLLYGTHQYGARFVSDELIDALSDVVPPRRPGEPLLRVHSRLAYVLQSILEESLMGLIENAVQRYRCKQVVLAGGVALNSKLNGKLLEQRLADRLFVQPAAADSGTSLGAALEAGKQIYGADPRFKQVHSCWGPAYVREQIEPVLKIEPGIRFLRMESGPMADRVARLIALGKPVAWFQGRREMGPRALFSTSILVDAADPLGNFLANMAKGRRWWRPSAISLTPREFRRLLSTGTARDAPFMITAFPIRADQAEKIRSGLHPADHSTRPQVVRYGENPLAFRLLQRLGRMTGVEAVLNTSFNIKEPIVHTPQQALHTFRRMAMVDYLAIGDDLVWKDAALDPSKACNPFHPENREWEVSETVLSYPGWRDWRRIKALFSDPPGITRVESGLLEILRRNGKDLRSPLLPFRRLKVTRSGLMRIEYLSPLQAFEIVVDRERIRIRFGVNRDHLARVLCLRYPPFSEWLKKGVMDDPTFEYGTGERTSEDQRLLRRVPNIARKGILRISTFLTESLTSG